MSIMDINNMSVLKSYRKAMFLWTILYVLASVIGMSLWFFFSPIFSNLVMVTFTPLVIFILARVYLKGILVDSPEKEGLRLAMLAGGYFAGRLQSH